MRNYGTSVARSPQVLPRQRKTFAVTDPRRRMKLSSAGAALCADGHCKNGIAHEVHNQNEKVAFDNLVARYYPALRSFASRLTDDPGEALMSADMRSIGR